MAFERRKDTPRRPDKNTGIPQVVASSQIAHASLQIGPLAERSNRRDLLGGCSLDVAVHHIKTRGAGTNGNQRIVHLSELHAGGDVAMELLLIENEVVERCHGHRRVGLQRLEAKGRIGAARNRIVSDEFAQYLFGPKLGDLLEDQLSVSGIRHDKEVLYRDDRRKTLERMMNKALPGA